MAIEENKSERINELIHNSNGKINEFLIKYASTPMGDQQLYKLISEQHKKLLQQLHDLFTGSSLSTQQQQQTTTSDAL
ncbi:unnamed protein product [Rotaria magnacalcarata]|uniref:Uncharacterized protein n=1 Tax=Rotaria magnacalcarata TaxID=392030 RepID=A0A816XYF9_9BILA|nr:unnamed protein product [Rotaria magnacalcarata]CAF1634163.1 unnamed protein product [Rotaria magnacalcarata]CAF2043979.1 unnamed protein product [Rotaria magnacalcarata]CAF2153074.1 unnamed protein product [Rotaria magnacalcarata]CAF2153868.1 unnamed protein product [Rotaria magnacalcarata]